VLTGREKIKGRKKREKKLKKCQKKKPDRF
jgi:hypothetical protein